MPSLNFNILAFKAVLKNKHALCGFSTTILWLASVHYALWLPPSHAMAVSSPRNLPIFVPASLAPVIICGWRTCYNFQTWLASLLHARWFSHYFPHHSDLRAAKKANRGKAINQKQLGCKSASFQFLFPCLLGVPLMMAYRVMPSNHHEAQWHLGGVL